MNIIGIDLGGTFIKIGILQNSELIAEKEIPVQDNLSLLKIAPQIDDQINLLLQMTGNKSLDGIGLAFPGQVDSRAMQVLNTTKYLDAPSFDFRDWAKRNWRAPIVIENDSRLACIGEWQFGSGTGCENMIMVTLGTGIGSGVILDNKIVYGKNYRAGNLIGHTILDYRAEPCQCGNRGCAESLASSWCLERLIRNDPDYKHSKYSETEAVTFELLFMDFKKGDALAKRTIEYCMEIWSAAITNLVHDFDPELVILGGGIMKSGDIILPMIEKNVLQRSWSTSEEISFRKTSLGNQASYWGTLYLLREKYK